ncbi:MAG TPA: AAA family ATPase [Candidatus Paceibacterota bacterium]
MKNKKPIVVAFIGLVGSGKQAIAWRLARLLKARLIDAKETMIELRLQGRDYREARKEQIIQMKQALARNKNVIICADYIDPIKRRELEKELKNQNARLCYVRVTCDRDVWIGRVVNVKNQGEFYEGASSTWRGSKRGTVVKLRELWRRTPWHYRWSNEGGGTWKLAQLTLKNMLTIDTTEERLWQKQVTKVAKILLRK